jgi:predicted ribosome quality control (RQC) complex YloA/Tae2 family protein
MREVRLTDFDGSTEVVVELDPAQGPRANLDRLFRKARRLLRGRDELESQRVIQIEELARAERVLAELEVPLAGSRLTELVEVWAPALLHPREGRELGAAAAPEKRSRGTLPEGFNPRRYELGLGWEVWVGKSSKQNDELTHRWARGHDLWFHARGCEGSHTVLRVDSGKGEPPREIVLKAAAIAAYHSKARNSRIVPVAYTEKRYVRKPRGAPVGTAAMMREKVVMVEPWVPEPGGG